MSNQLIHADVYMIPCYGQSLSLNTSAGQSTFDDIEPLSYDSELRNTNIQDMCAGTAEGFRLAAEYYGIGLPEEFKIIGCTGGAGGVCVSDLSKGSVYYENVLRHIRAAKENCDREGLSLIVPCFTWTQGEEDMRAGGNAAAYGYGKFDPFAYKDRLKKLIEDLNEDIKQITGQDQDVLCISYQLACHTSYGRYPRIALQQQELAAEYDKMVIAKAMYDVEYVHEETYEVHAYARTYRNMGNLYGIAAFRACVLGQRSCWCRPVAWDVCGNKVIIRFEMPCKPLSLDSERIRQLPDGNYGFQIYRVDEQSGRAGSIVKADTKIREVRIAGEDTVELVLSRKPVSGERLTYGINGDYWQNINGVKMIMEGGEGEDGYTKAGRLCGSRGLLRDSQPLKNPYPGAVFRDLYNWCVIFEIPFA